MCCARSKNKFWYKKAYRNRFYLNSTKWIVEKMSLIGFVAVAAVAFVVTVDGGAQPQFYPQQNPFINYYRPEVIPNNNNMMNKLNRHRRPVINNNPTVFSDYLAQDQAKIFFGITNFFTS